MSKLSKNTTTRTRTPEQKNAAIQKAALNALLIAGYIMEDTAKIVAGIKDLQVQCITNEGQPGFAFIAKPSEALEGFWETIMSTPMDKSCQMYYDDEKKVIWFGAIENIKPFVKSFVFHYAGPNILKGAPNKPIRSIEEMTKNDVLLFSHSGYPAEKGLSDAFARLQKLAQQNPLIGYTFKLEDMDLAFNIIEYEASGITRYPTDTVLRFQ